MVDFPWFIQVVSFIIIRISIEESDRVRSRVGDDKIKAEGGNKPGNAASPKKLEKERKWMLPRASRMNAVLMTSLILEFPAYRIVR